jgi:hypothetical protein
MKDAKMLSVRRAELVAASWVVTLAMCLPHLQGLFNCNRGWEAGMPTTTAPVSTTGCDAVAVRLVLNLAPAACIDSTRSSARAPSARAPSSPLSTCIYIQLLYYYQMLICLPSWRWDLGDRWIHLLALHSTG